MEKKEVVISTRQINFWQKQLPGAHIVCEDWTAGNGLGTLYAFQQSGLLEKLKAGAAVALYHTAGQGTRLAPLPASEGHNKSAVKIPPGITLLEAVIEQSLPLAQPGRLSVFWGDQLFYPSIPLREPTHDVEIFAQVQNPPTAKEWEERHLSQYGLLLIKDGDAKQLEKIDYPTFQQQSYEQVGISLGSFSLSAAFLEELLNEFASELKHKNTKLDTDRDFWMPLSWGGPRFDRFGKGRIGAIDIGHDATWLDFGTLANYHKSCLALGETQINVKANKIEAKNSVLINVTAPEIYAENAILYNVHSETPIHISGKARADAQGMTFTAPLNGSSWDKCLDGNPMSFSDLAELNAVKK